MSVPVRDNEASVRFFARIFGLAYDGPMPPFAPVRVNDRLTLDFDDHDDHGILHYAFKVSDEEFDAIFGRIQAEGIPYGSGPYRSEEHTSELKSLLRRSSAGFCLKKKKKTNKTRSKTQKNTR